MNDGVLVRPEAGAPTASPLESLARRALLRQLEDLGQGTLLIQAGERLYRFGAGLPEARVRVLNPAFWSRVALGGSVGAGESFMAGDWHSDDLTGLLRLLLRNRAVVDGLETGLARLSSPLRRLFHSLNRNTRAGSRRNIAAHYDLGNDFYRLWLDETLMYSCALFERPEMTLAEASTAKLERISQARPGPPSPRAGDRQRLGRLRPACGWPPW